MEFRNGFAFLGPDRELYAVMLRDGGWAAYAVDRHTLEQREVWPSHSAR
jgi:hypothetical protein